MMQYCKAATFVSYPAYLVAQVRFAVRNCFINIKGECPAPLDTRL